ncbi:MAG: alpha-2-macroglobulin family protein, partial [Bacteroidota bacterium]|nr:alpha-2-macroglobulin family protein [Bacteroidota bacterium]
EGQAGGVDYSLIEVTEAPKKDEIVKEEVMNKESGGKNYLNNKEVGVRKKLQETAFFYPHLVTNQDGEITFTFTAPEALTRWKLMTFAHTKDMHYGLAEKEVVTQKELMIQSNAPRFLREGDTLYFTARVTNLKDTVQSGTAKLDLFNAENNKSLDDLLGSSEQLQNFSLGKKENKSLSWKLIVPYGGVQAVTWRLTAATDSSTDGEEGLVPVLTNSQLVTESMPIELNGHEKKDLVFKGLEENNSTTLRHHKLTFEFTSDPVWYAVLSLPYLMEYEYDCLEQTFSKYFANSMAEYLVNSDPKIKQVFERWKKDGRDSLKSNLMKNQELKNIILEETPWLYDAKDEKVSRQKLTELFDIIKLADRKAENEKRLQQAQLRDGGWPWFDQMVSSPYISKHIIAGLGHLDKLNIIKIRGNRDLWKTLSRAIEYCDNDVYKEYKALTAMRGITEDLPVDEQIIHYLYVRSYFMDVPLKAEYQKVFDFWNKKAEEQWLSKSKYMQGMIALSAYRQGNKLLAQQIISSIKENAVISDEMGMYFKENQGWYWFDAPIERQSLIIEAFNEISKDT